MPQLRSSCDAALRQQGPERPLLTTPLRTDGVETDAIAARDAGRALAIAVSEFRAMSERMGHFRYEVKKTASTECLVESMPLRHLAPSRSPRRAAMAFFMQR